MDVFIKEVSIDDADNEIELQTIASSYGFCPKILGTQRNADTISIVMERIRGDTISDYYGDDPSDTPKEIWDKIREIVTTLYWEEGIEYRDITPYNFMICDDSIYIIDFGDAIYTDYKNPSWFFQEFIDGENSWNPDYK